MGLEWEGFWVRKKARVCMGLGWEGFWVREKARVCFKSGTKEKAMSACVKVVSVHRRGMKGRSC